MALVAIAALLAAARWRGAWRRCAACLATAQVARYIEEREPSLGDRLVTAVDVAAGRRIRRRSPT